VLCGDTQKAGSGTAVAISGTEALSAAHVLSWCKEEKKKIILTQGDKKFTVMTVRAHEKADIMRLTMQKHTFRNWAYIDRTGLLLGDYVCSFGYSIIGHNVQKCGYVHNVTDKRAYWEGHVVPGNSGGPLFRRGRLVAIVVAGIWQFGLERVGVAVNIDKALEAVK
jgi:hypothetical protein